MWKHLCATGALALSANGASSPPSAPSAGIVREPDNSLRMLGGFSGNYILGETLPFDSALKSSFSDEAGLILTGNAVRLVTPSGGEIAAYPVSDSGAVLSITAKPETALVWLPSQNTVLRWSGKFIPVEVTLPASGQIVADLRYRDENTFDLLLRDAAGRLEQAEVSFDRGSIRNIIPLAATTGSALWSGRAVLFESEAGLSVAAGANPVQSFDLGTKNLLLSRAGDGSVQVTSTDGQRQWMLRIERGRATLSEIPVPSLSIAAPPLAENRQ